MSTTRQTGRSAPGIDVTHLRRLAEHAAWIGGEFARKAFGRRPRVRHKADGSEVTAVDLAAQKAILRFLRQRRPQDRFVAEEEAGRRSAGRPQVADPLWWVVDPLDGTRNFSRGLGAFACSVAVLRDGIPIAGAIYEPLMETMYSAAAGLGATRNGRAMRRVVAPKSGRRLLVAVPSIRDKLAAGQVQAAFDQHVVRNLGSTALHMALVAEGALDATIANQCKLWDIAAGTVILAEVGAAVLGLDAAPIFPLDPSRYEGATLPTFAGPRNALKRLGVK